MNIVGHQKIIKFLERVLEKKNLAGAYIFSGFSGVGKFKAALLLAERILGQDSNRISDSLIILEPDREITFGNSAVEEDVKSKNEKKGIRVEEIRELKRKLSLSSSSGKKVAIIRGAEKLNKSSQNALLKILEEPNEGLTLILVADDEKKLFPTIISRCQKIHFGIVSEKEMDQLIDSQEKKLSAEVKQAIIFWSVGRPGLALEMLRNPEKLNFQIQSFEEAKKLLQETVFNKFSLAENLAKDTDLALKKMSVWVVGIRESLLKGKADFASQEKCLEIIDKINESQGLLKQTNANARLILENLFLAFSKKIKW
jgi:DNA polymerase-3 subunit delta'